MQNRNASSIVENAALAEEGRQQFAAFRMEQFRPLVKLWHKVIDSTELTENYDLNDPGCLTRINNALGVISGTRGDGFCAKVTRLSHRADQFAAALFNEQDQTFRYLADAPRQLGLMQMEAGFMLEKRGINAESLADEHNAASASYWPLIDMEKFAQTGCTDEATHALVALYNALGEVSENLRGLLASDPGKALLASRQQAAEGWLRWA